MTARDHQEISREDLIREIDALHAQQVQLEMQNTELREAQLRIEKTMSRYAEVNDRAPVAYCTLEVDGRIRELNLAAARLLGESRDALVGLPFARAAGVEDERLLWNHWKACKKERGPVTNELTFNTGTGSPRTVRIISEVVRVEQGAIPAYQTILFDLTDLKLVENRLHLLSTAAERLTTSLDQDALIDAALCTVVPAVADLCMIDLVTASGALERRAVLFSDAKLQTALGESMMNRKPTSEPGWQPPQARVVASGEPMLLSDLARDRRGGVNEERHADCLAAPDIRSLMVLPLSARGRTFGALTFAVMQSGRGYATVDLEIASELSSRIAIALDNAQLYDDAQRSAAIVRELRAAESASAEREIRGYQERIQQMAVEAIVTEDRERRRIAADLHDGVGQSLALSQIKLTAAREEVVGSPREAIDQVIALLGQAIASTRALTFELSPPILYDLGLKEALCWLAEKLEATHATRIEIADDDTDKPLDDVTAGLVFRATRELLMNVVKHSRAPTAKVSLRRAGDHLVVTVEDTGIGFEPDDPKARSDGFGLLSVHEQIRRLRGSTEVIASPGQGARVAISVPLSA